MTVKFVLSRRAVKVYATSSLYRAAYRVPGYAALSAQQCMLAQPWHVQKWNGKYLNFLLCFEVFCAESAENAGKEIRYSLMDFICSFYYN